MNRIRTRRAAAARAAHRCGAAACRPPRRAQARAGAMARRDRRHRCRQGAQATARRRVPSVARAARWRWPTARPICGTWHAAEPDAAARRARGRSRRAPRRAARRSRRAPWRHASDEAEAMRLLRRMKAEAALLIALADIGGVWPVMRGDRGADRSWPTRRIGAAVRFLLAAPMRARQAQARRSGASPSRAAAYIVLAMGKMGAFELNYSSDIDLIVFYDPDAPALVPRASSRRRSIVRITRGLVKLLQERTADGYVFRVDLRLRPDPASTQIAVSTDAGARLLRERRAELGARGDDQGAGLRRRHRGRRGLPRGARRRSSGASISTSRRSPTSRR